MVLTKEQVYGRTSKGVEFEVSHLISHQVVVVIRYFWQWRSWCVRLKLMIGSIKH